jgi:hypothetical protein
MCYTDQRRRILRKHIEMSPLIAFISNLVCKIGTGKGKEVKLTLGLTKHHAMKTYWGCGGTAPRILKFDTR